MDTMHTQITDPYTSMFEAVHGADDEATVTAEPCHLYTSEGDARLYYFASDRTWWTINEDTGATAPAEEPAHLEDGDVDMSFFEHWRSDDNQDWIDLIEDQARIDAAKKAIETTPVGYAGVIGRDDWGVCMAVATSIAATTAVIRKHAKDSGDSFEAVMMATSIKPVTRRYASAWSLDMATAFTLRPVEGGTIVDLTDDALGAW